MARDNMTYYSSNELLDAQVYWAQRPNEAIMRPEMYPFLNIGLKNAPMFLADFNQIKESTKRNATAHSLDRSPAPTTSARACEHTACCGDCTETALTWTPLVAHNICMSYTRGADNMFDQTAQLANAIRNRMLDLYRDMEAAALAAVLANQTTIHNGVNGLGTWAADIWGVAIADRHYYFNYVYNMMLANYYGGWPMNIVNTLSLNAEYQDITNQGPGNALNLQWQTMGMKMWASATLPVTAGYRGDSIVIPEGTVGVVPWIPKINRDNTGSIDGAAGYWTTMPSIFNDGLTFAVHITSSCGDTSQTNGDTQDYVTNYELSIDLASAVTPFAGGQTSIYHTGLLTT